MRGRPRADIHRVTDRQREVARLIADGHTNEEIAQALGISLAGAKYHVSELLGRLGLERREEIAAWHREEQSLHNRARRLGAFVGIPAAWAGGGVAAAVAIVLLVVVVSVVREEPRSATAPHEGTSALGHREGRPSLLLVHGTEIDTSAGVIGRRSLLTPLDAASGRRLDGYATVEVQRGQVAWSELRPSPDGTHVAVVDTRIGSVTFLDLEHWDADPVVLTAEPPGGSGNVRLTSLQWSPDGSRLFAWRPYCSGGYCPPDVVDELWVLEPRAGTVHGIGRFDFRREDMAVSPDGTRVYVLANTRYRDINNPDPYGAVLVVVDIPSGDIVGVAPLPEVAIGFGRGQPPLDDLVWAARYQPAIAADDTHVYIAHADEAKVTAVDLQMMAVDRVISLDEPRSPLSRVLGWLRSQFVQEAAAKSGQAWERTIAISPDGRFLLVSGIWGGTFVCPGDEGELECYRGEPFGLTVVDIATDEIVFRDPSIGAFEVTRDGSRVVGILASATRPGAQGSVASSTARGLMVISLQSLSIEHHLLPELEVRSHQTWTSADSRYAYVTTYASGFVEIDGVRHWNPCDGECHLLHILDLELGEVIAEVPLESPELLPLPGP